MSDHYQKIYTLRKINFTYSLMAWKKTYVTNELKRLDYIAGVIYSLRTLLNEVVTVERINEISP